eukprot:IDg11153t1
MTRALALLEGTPSRRATLFSGEYTAFEKPLSPSARLGNEKFTHPRRMDEKINPPGNTGGEYKVHHSAHHIEEFGYVAKLVHLEDSDKASITTPSGTHKTRRLWSVLFSKRHLQQHFAGDTLYRTITSRRIVQDELLLDLIIVGNIAAIGHDLRENFSGWREFETFVLLFGAVFSSWRALVTYWNLWGVSGDLLDKAVVYTTVAMLTGIGVGAHAAFGVARPYVCAAAFFASAIPSAVNAI